MLIRQGFPGRTNRIELVHWFPETARTVDTYPFVEQTCQAFAAAGFSRGALEQIPETYRTTLAEFLAQADTFRRADTTMRNLTEEEFLRGKERLRRAAQDAEKTPTPRTQDQLTRPPGSALRFLPAWLAWTAGNSRLAPFRGVAGQL